MIVTDPAPASSSVAPSLSLDIAVRHVEGWLHDGIRLLPNLVVAVVVIALFYGLAILARRVVLRSLSRHGRDNLGEILGSFTKVLVIVVGFLLAATIVIPSLKPGDLIAGLGVSSIAIGFAFKDILQNWLAGVLILIRQPFNVGDQIVIQDFEGVVERIETRATIIKTYDGQRAVIPNSDIYTHAVLVRTAHAIRRSQYDIGIGYGDGVDEACRIIREALAEVEDIEHSPAPEALPWDLAASWVTVRARWWTRSKRADVVQVRARVIRAVKEALDAAGIDMPYDTKVHLFHDQTEDNDGVRGTQREGWPQMSGERTMPRWKAQADVQTKTRTDAGSEGS